MKQPVVPIPPAEWDVMETLWETGACPVREVVRRLAERKGWRSSTSRTLLRRLAQKGAVRIQKIRRPFLYEARLNRQECTRRQSRSLLQRLFGGQPVEMLVHLVEETPMTPRDIQRLREILARKTE
jgi:BlaI family penicillinase repressor